MITIKLIMSTLLLLLISFLIYIAVYHLSFFMVMMTILGVTDLVITFTKSFIEIWRL